jgi:hypothetical protein
MSPAVIDMEDGNQTPLVEDAPELAMEVEKPLHE